MGKNLNLDNLNSNLLQIRKTYSLLKIEGGKYPTLSAMAKKFLPIPATSTPCERLFSPAKRITTIARARLEAKATKTLVLSSYWSQDIQHLRKI